MVAAPALGDKLSVVSGDVPKSPFVALGRVAAVGRHNLSGDCRLFWLSTQIHFLHRPPFACRFPSGSNFFKPMNGARHVSYAQFLFRNSLVERAN